METVTYLNFEWDRTKAKLNKIKHGISFKAAAKVFNIHIVLNNLTGLTLGTKIVGK